jgi:hypothetical protein
MYLFVALKCVVIIIKSSFNKRNKEYLEVRGQDRQSAASQILDSSHYILPVCKLQQYPDTSSHLEFQPERICYAIALCAQHCVNL